VFQRDSILGYIFRKLTTDDITQIMDLQYTYQKVYPKAVVIPAEVYLSPFLNGGENMICAFNDEGTLKGYAGVNVYLAQQPDAPHTVWGIVKVDPVLTSRTTLQNLLFQKSLEKACELVKLHPGHETRMLFQHHVSEEDITGFLKTRGCVYLESAFHMMYDISLDPVAVPIPINIVARYLDKDNFAELQEYVNSRNECFPLRVMTFKEWQYYFETLIGKNGKVISAFQEGKLIGGITVSWDLELNKRLGIDMGETEDVFVLGPWRQRGIAAYLIGLGLQYFKENGLKFGHLEVRTTNEGALKLYQKIGYKVSDETRMYSLMLKD
jgi:ribosomal protein S18 acetylase RimI-like enzyme